MRTDGKLDPARIGGYGAAVSYVLTWDGARAVWSAGGDSDHASTGLESVAVGGGVGEAQDYGTAVGRDAYASAQGVAVGYAAVDDVSNGIAVGYNAGALASGSVVIGHSALVTASATGGSVAIGSAAEAAADSVVVGGSAFATAAASVAVGGTARARGANAVAVGQAADVSTGSADCVVLGQGASVTGGADRAIALGKGATVATSDRFHVQANELELVRSVAGTGTSIILADTVTGTRYRGYFASGVWTTALA